MSDALMARAAASFLDIVRTIDPAQLAARTPCSGYDVRGLVNHLLFWGPSLEAAARKESVSPPAASEADVDLTRGDWAAALQAQVERTVAAWRRPGAWEGTTQLGSPMELPASLIGDMVLGELVVHGWDLARATGQQLGVDDEVGEHLAEAVAKTAEQGREMGVYGPEVPVPDTAPPLARVLGLTGRDPGWVPAP
jgi:uncharacterized protein (TIGR03086 family)